VLRIPDAKKPPSTGIIGPPTLLRLGAERLHQKQSVDLPLVKPPDRKTALPDHSFPVGLGRLIQRFMSGLGAYTLGHKTKVLSAQVLVSSRRPASQAGGRTCRPRCVPAFPRQTKRVPTTEEILPSLARAGNAHTARKQHRKKGCARQPNTLAHAARPLPTRCKSWIGKRPCARRGARTVRQKALALSSRERGGLFANA